LSRSRVEAIMSCMRIVAIVTLALAGCHQSSSTRRDDPSPQQFATPTPTPTPSPAATGPDYARWVGTYTSANTASARYEISLMLGGTYRSDGLHGTIKKCSARPTLGPLLVCDAPVEAGVSLTPRGDAAIITTRDPQLGGTLTPRVFTPIAERAPFRVQFDPAWSGIAYAGIGADGDDFCQPRGPGDAVSVPRCFAEWGSRCCPASPALASRCVSFGTSRGFRCENYSH
jgi:hypothetical protein